LEQLRWLPVFIKSHIVQLLDRDDTFGIIRTQEASARIESERGSPSRWALPKNQSGTALMTTRYAERFFRSIAPIHDVNVSSDSKPSLNPMNFA
jgi:hypothetical protein